MPDPETLRFYADNAASYVRHAESPTPQLAGFLARLPGGGTILELGTGNGRDAAAMLAAGFAVTPSDASPELAAQAEARLGRQVRIMAFHELDQTAAYDGVWACAALLHAPRDELTDDLAAFSGHCARAATWLPVSRRAAARAATSLVVTTTIPTLPNYMPISSRPPIGPASTSAKAMVRAMTACRRAGCG